MLGILIVVQLFVDCARDTFTRESVEQNSVLESQNKNIICKLLVVLETSQYNSSPARCWVVVANFIYRRKNNMTVCVYGLPRPILRLVFDLSQSPILKLILP